jgi:hypothetical protein
VKTALLAAIVVLAILPRGALAHDDPVLTVRVLAQGLTDGQIDTAMGEVDDNATILVDRQVTGRAQIIAWMQQQLQLNLRIEVVDVQPTQTADGYDVTWTTHMFREDWRKAGIAMRPTTEHASIHNGRITRWTSSLATELNPTAARQQAIRTNTVSLQGTGPSIAGVPLSQVPLGLVALAVLVMAGGGWFVLGVLRPHRGATKARPTPVIEALVPGARERKT